MPFMLPRMSADFDPASGLLRAEHFQMAYATNDLAAARHLFADRLGIRQFATLEGDLADGGYIRVELAWVGSIMYELIEATGPGSAIYNSLLPDGEGVHIKHHHLGYLVHDQAQWDGVMAQADRNGWGVPYKSRNPLLQACFVDVSELGHYLEYLFPEQAGIDFLESVPRS